MKPTSYTNFKLNDQLVTLDPAAKAESETAFAKFEGPKDKDKFSVLEFTLKYDALKTEVRYLN